MYNYYKCQAPWDKRLRRLEATFTGQIESWRNSVETHENLCQNEFMQRSDNPALVNKQINK